LVIYALIISPNLVLALIACSSVPLIVRKPMSSASWRLFWLKLWVWKSMIPS